MEMRAFGEIVPEKKRFGVGEKVPFAELVDKSFVVLDYEVFPSRFEGCKEFAVILIQHNETQAVTTTSSRVIVDQLTKIKDSMPVKVHLQRRKKYFTFA